MSERLPGSLERLTVNLTPRASRALGDVVKLTGDSKTDSVNRAISVYAYVERVLRDGGTLLVRAGGEAEPRVLVIL